MLPILNYITWNVSPFIYEGEHFAIGWYGTLWTLGLILWLIVEHIIYRHEHIDSAYVWYKFLYLGIGLLIGARIGHCWGYEWFRTNDPITFMGLTFNYRNVFIEKPWLMFDIRDGVHGLSSHGGGAGVLFAVWLLDKCIFHTGTLWIFDRTTLGACWIGFCIRLGNLFNSEIYGVPTDLPWGFLFVNNGDVSPCHPTQIYEMLYLFGAFLILVWLYCKKDAGKYRGLLFGSFLTFVFIVRILLEFIKQNQAEFESNLLLGLNMGQWLSVPFLIGGVFLIVYSLSRGKQPVISPQLEGYEKTTKKVHGLKYVIPLLFLVSCQSPSPHENNYAGEYVITKEIDDDFVLEGEIDCPAKSRCIFYHYTSVDADGVKDTLSAVIVINRNCWKRKSVKGITLWNRPTITASRNCPSEMNLIAEPVIAKFTNTAVVSPDLRGFGCNHKPQAYCYATINGRASADALFAAERILDSMGVILSGNTLYNIGYSQGAQTALSALTFLNNAKVKTFLGEGIYDFGAYYEQALQKDTIAIPAAIPLTLITAVEYAGLKIEYEQCFSNRTYLQMIEDVHSKQYSFPELNSRMHSRRITQILSPPLCDTTTKEYIDLKIALQLMSFIPYQQISHNNKIYIFHSTTDKIMPISQSLGLESTLRESCAFDVHHKYKDFGSHDNAILPFVKYALLKIVL